MKLNILHHLPAHFLHTDASKLHELLGGPTLIHLKEGEGQPVFISTLLHGNEHSGILALQKILHQNQLKRPLIIFIGNTLAAQKNHRHLPDQLDFNRIWSGGHCNLAQIAKEVTDYAKNQNILCSIDMHNNTGKNPYYACINKLDNQFFYLANHFCEKIVYFTEPQEVQSMAFSKFCPSVTLEVGKSGDLQGIKLLVSKIQELLKWKEVSDNINASQLTIYHTIARMKFTFNSTLDFDFNPQSNCEYSFLKDFDKYNFNLIKKGEVLAYVNNPCGLWAEGPEERNHFEEFFEYKNNQLVAIKDFIPSMITQDQKILKSDCFGYIMETFPL